MSTLSNATLDKIKNRQAKIGIIGLGYVGLPLAMAARSTSASPKAPVTEVRTRIWCISLWSCSAGPVRVIRTRSSRRTSRSASPRLSAFP